MGWVGHGATLNGRPIHVSDSASLDDGLLSIGMSPRIGPEEILPIVDKLLRQGVVYYREGSGALSLAYVAAGRLIGYIESHLNSWDGAAGVAIVQAAEYFGRQGADPSVQETPEPASSVAGSDAGD